jgi:glycosyltransferase involved in cell wall biosynthesis
MIYIVGKNIGDFRGGATVAKDILYSLYESNFEISVISVGFAISDKFFKIPHIKMPYRTNKNDYPQNLSGKIRFSLKRFEYILKWLNLKLQFKLNPPTLMIFNDTFHSTREIIDEYKKLSPLVQIVHISPTFVKNYFGEYSLENCFEDLNKADVLMFVSDECRKEWIDEGQGELNEQKTYYIPNCANEVKAKKYLDRSKATTRHLMNLKSDKFYMINVASLKKWKGQDILIEAAPELKKIAPNLEILMVGSGGGKFVSELKDIIEEKDLDFVHFLGHRSNAMEYIYASDLFVLPSRAEAFPLVILEAMILKTPVIGSDVGGVPEMVTLEQTGLLFECDNADELIQRFKKLYRNPRIAKECAENASDKYWCDFSKEQFSKRYVSLVEQVLEKD